MKFKGLKKTFVYFLLLYCFPSGAWTPIFSEKELFMCLYKNRLCQGLCAVPLPPWSSPYRVVLPKIHSDSITSVKFAQDAHYNVSASYDGTIRIWGNIAEKWLTTLTGHSDAVTSVDISPDGTKIVSGSWDGTVKLWDFDGKLLDTLCNFELCLINSVAFSSDGTKIVAGGQILNVRDGNCGNHAINGIIIVFEKNILKFFLEEVSGIQEDLSVMIRSIEFLSDNEHAISSSRDGTVKVWDINENVAKRQLRVFKPPVDVTSVAFALDDGLIAYGCQDGTIRITNRAGQCIKILQGHCYDVWSLDFSSDEKFLVSGSKDCTIRVWDVESGDCLAVLDGHTNTVTSVKFSPRGCIIISGDCDGNIIFWSYDLTVDAKMERMVKFPL